ncbi:hypothetical protein TESG_01214 [Trichophyton tonsurans CBS 112818]|uniref:Uncharacterized protein n=1 Tax=Trichophyton tonsurans (strain CBS 112818) TaxID=647933 RepID=F2RQS5_TRIT1|nr:hypothetical protein TESG_01214 [Trichophyton tonsurans CBS 112818]
MFATRALGFRSARPLFEPIPLRIEGTAKRSHHLPTSANTQEDSSGVDPSRVAICAAIYSSGKKLFEDKTLRLSRSKREDH